MRGTELLTLLHLADSAYPSGAFACSYGMETLVEAGWVRDRATAERAVRDGLAGAVGGVELPSVCRAHRAASAGAWDRIGRLNGWLDAFAHARESREASKKVGRRFLASALTMLPGAPAGVAVLLDGGGLHQCLAIGAAAALFGIAAEDATFAYAWTYCNGQLSAAARLVPLGQRDVLLAHAALRAAAARAAEEAARCRPGARAMVGTPLADVARMRHERAEARLFVS